MNHVKWDRVAPEHVVKAIKLIGNGMLIPIPESDYCTLKAYNLHGEKIQTTVTMYDSGQFSKSLEMIDTLEPVKQVFIADDGRELPDGFAAGLPKLGFAVPIKNLRSHDSRKNNIKWTINNCDVDHEILINIVTEVIEGRADRFLYDKSTDLLWRYTLGVMDARRLTAPIESIEYSIITNHFGVTMPIKCESQYKCIFGYLTTDVGGSVNYLFDNGFYTKQYSACLEIYVPRTYIGKIHVQLDKFNITANNDYLIMIIPKSPVSFNVDVDVD